MKQHTWVPVVAAVAGTALTVKAGMLILGGADALGPAEGLLYLGGLLLGLVACIGIGVRQDGLGRSLAVGLASSLLLVAWVIGLGEVVEPLVGLVSDSRVIREETAVLIAGLALLGVSALMRSRDAAQEPVAV